MLVLWPMKPRLINSFPYVKLATQSTASVQQCSGLKHIDGWCLGKGYFLNLACKLLLHFLRETTQENWLLDNGFSVSTCVYVEIAELLGIDAKPFIFSYAELKTATEDFNPDNKLGEGGFGPVYKVIPYSNQEL